MFKILKYNWLFKSRIVMEAYCMKCKTKQEMKNTEQIIMKNGRPAMKGSCSVCSGGMYRIMSNSK